MVFLDFSSVLITPKFPVFLPLIIFTFFRLIVASLVETLSVKIEMLHDGTVTTHASENNGGQ